MASNNKPNPSPKFDEKLLACVQKVVELQARNRSGSLVTDPNYLAELELARNNISSLLTDIQTQGKQPRYFYLSTMLNVSLGMLGKEIISESLRINLCYSTGTCKDSLNRSQCKIKTIVQQLHNVVHKRKPWTFTKERPLLRRARNTKAKITVS